MSVSLPCGVTLTVEAALSAATGGCGVWGSGSAADVSLWDAALWGPDETWTDISAYVRSLRTRRGFSRDVQGWETGVATLVLDNRDARFTAENLGGPYVTGGITEIRPWRPVRIVAEYAGVSYPVYRGYAMDWSESYTAVGPGGGDATVTVPCRDEWARLARVDGLEQPAAGAGELFGARIHRILDFAGHTGARSVDIGTVTMQDTTLAQNVATMLKLTADSEGGAVWVEADGSIVGARQYALVENPRSIVAQAVFGDAPGEIGYVDPSLSGSGELLLSQVSYTRVGGTAQTAFDPVTQALYGPMSETRTDLVCETDAQADVLASWRLARFKEPERRVTSIKIEPAGGPTTRFPVALGLLVRDLVEVKRQVPGGVTLDQFCHVSGIEHDVSPGRWVTTLRFSSATVYRRFSESLWDTGLWGASAGDLSAALWFY